MLVSPLRPRSVDTASRSQPRQCKGFLNVNTAHRCGTWRMAQRADVMSVPRRDHWPSADDALTIAEAKRRSWVLLDNDKLRE